MEMDRFESGLSALALRMVVVGNKRRIWQKRKKSSWYYWQEENHIFHKSNEKQCFRKESKTIVVNAIDNWRQRRTEKKPFGFKLVDYL